MKKQFFLFLLVTVVITVSFAQNKQSKNYDQDIVAPIDPRFFSSELLGNLVLDQINERLQFDNKEQLRSNKILLKAAEDQAAFMAQMNSAKAKQSGNKKDVGSRIEFYGGSNYGEELVMKMNAKYGNDYLSYTKITEEIIFKWLGNKKNAALITNPDFLFIGVSGKLDSKAKKIYISGVLGSYKSFNAGAVRRSELEVPYSKKKLFFALKPFNKNECKKIKKVKNIIDMQGGLSVKDGYIYFKYDNIKALKKIFKEKKDGLAVDVVQKSQFPCVGENIIDNTLVNKGVLTKMMKSKKLFKKNLIKGRKVKKLEVKLAKFPASLVGSNYELNLLVIKNKHVCQSITPSYVVDGGIEYTKKLDFLADTVNAGTEYNPKVSASTLEFKIPFERSKVTYNAADIDAFIKQLNEPNFIINNIDISAFSSVEGSVKRNLELQKERAESIISVFHKMQKSDIKTNIKTSNNLKDFYEDIKGTEYELMDTMAIEDIQDYIREHKLTKVLEPILSKHRYALIKMTVTFDITGQKEEPFVLRRLNKAIEQENLPEALSIQKYIMKKVYNGEYDNSAISKEIIPEKTKFAGLLMNKFWMEIHAKDEALDGKVCDRIGDLTQLDPENPYILFNYIYCDLMHTPLGTEGQINGKQALITKLYETTLSKETVDALNLEFQFKIIHAYDTLPTPHPVMVSSLNRIKKIINVDEANWQNALKLSYIFTAQKDYKFAMKLLEPFLEEEFVFEELLFTYISLCTKVENAIYSHRFSSAIKKAQKSNPDRFCKLFKKGSKFTFQVLENVDIKKDICGACLK